MHIIAKIPEISGVLPYFVQKGNMRKTILLLSLCLSLSALAADNVERAAIVPQRLLPTGNTTQQSSQQRTVLQRDTDGDTTTSGSSQRAVAGRTAVVREKPVARTATNKSVVSAQPSGKGNVVRSVVTRFTPSSVNSGSRANDPQTSAGLTGKVGTGLTARGTTKNTRVSAESAAATKATMESLSELTETCRNSYYECMDNFCNVIDEDMGRCACSKNIKNYEKTTDALAAATKELQEVSQKIQYLGLTPKEITTLFTETSAEKALGQNVDSSTLKNDLERIRGMIVDVNSGSSVSSVSDSSDLSMDLSNLLDFNVSSSSFSIESLFSTSGNTQSISNQRGEALYKSGVARCKSGMLKSCSQYGVDTATIINSYDVEIDKDCMLYERKLTDENTAMLSTIRNAKVVLQKARLMVAQQKNEYDLRGCISALDSCMQDEFVCGTDYENCLDPTGKYIVKGEVVMGSMPGPSGANGMWNGSVVSDGLYTVWNYDGKNIYATNDNYNVKQYILDTMDVKSAQNSTAKDVSRWLQNRMGWHDDTTGNNHGLCVAVLNKCQKYSYDDRGKYFVKDGTKVNPVIQSWLETAFKKIKQGQDRVLANYARGCISEVSQCLTQNNFYGTYVNTTSVSGSNPSDVAIRSCLPTINTCRSVTLGLGAATVSAGDDLSNIYVWLNKALGTTYSEPSNNNPETPTVVNLTITLNPYTSGATGGTSKIYTIKDDGVFLNSGRTQRMTTSAYCVTAPTLANYDFAGYFSDPTNGTKYIDANGCITSAGLTAGKGYDADKTWYAHWTQQPVVIQTEISLSTNVGGGGNNGIVSSGTTKIYTTQGVGVFLNNGRTQGMATGSYPVTVPVRDGYTFGGYSSNSSGGTQYINESGYITSDGLSAGMGYDTNKTWYAQWTADEIIPVEIRTTITLNKNGGASPYGATATSKLYTIYNTGVYSDEGRSVAARYITQPVKNGYTFQGYYDSTSGTDEYINFAGTITTLGSDTAKSYKTDKTWYAKWEPRVYTITLDDAYYSSSSETTGTSVTTSVSPNKIYMKYNTGWYSNYSATTPISHVTVPTYTGYQFGGFYTQKAGAGTQIIDENGDITGSSGSFVTPSTSVTLYAKWEVACGSNEEYVNGSCKCQSGYYRSGSNGTCKTTCDSGYLAIVGEEMCYEFNGNSDFYSDMYCAVDPIDNGPGGCPSFGSTNWGEGSCSDLDVLGNSACSSLNVGDLSYDNPGESSGNVCWCKVEKSKSHMDLEDPAATTHTFWVKQLNTTNYCSSAATCAQYCLDLYRIEGTGTMTNCGNTISWAPNRARLLLYIGG